MPQQNQQKKGCTKARVSKSKVAQYWSWKHTQNMFRRVKRVYNRYARLYGKRAISGGHWDKLQEVANSEAKKCASAHGPVVEGMLARWLRGEKP